MHHHCWNTCVYQKKGEKRLKGFASLVCTNGVTEEFAELFYLIYSSLLWETRYSVMFQMLLFKISF